MVCTGMPFACRASRVASTAPKKHARMPRCAYCRDSISVCATASPARCGKSNGRRTACPFAERCERLDRRGEMLGARIVAQRQRIAGRCKMRQRRRHRRRGRGRPVGQHIAHLGHRIDREFRDTRVARHERGRARAVTRPTPSVSISSSRSSSASTRTIPRAGTPPYRARRRDRRGRCAMRAPACCGGARGRHELARGAHGIEFEQDRARAGIAREIVEHVARIDVGLAAERDDVRKAEAPCIGPAEHRVRQRVRLRHPRDAARSCRRPARRNARAVQATARRGCPARRYGARTASPPSACDRARCDRHRCAPRR